MLAGNLSALVVEGVAVTVAAGFSENGYAVVILDPAQLNVVWNVAEHHVSTDAVPCTSFGPECVRASVKPLHRRIAYFVFVETRVE